MIWTGDDDARLIRLWDSGLSQTQIAREMGLTVGSIAGRRCRLRYGPFLPNDPAYQIKLPKSRRKRAEPVKNIPPELQPLAEVTIKHLEIISRNPGVDYLANTGCKALLERRGHWQLPMCCGRRCGYDFYGAKTPYCPTHFRLYTNPPAERRRRYG